MPSLRILDGQRFDPAFIARKAKRAARPPTLDVGEPTTSANAEPVGERPVKQRRIETDNADDVAAAPVAKERKKREKERKDAVEDVPTTSSLLALPKPPEPAKVPAPADARDRSNAGPARERTSVVAVIDVAGTKKRKRKAGAAADDGAELAAFFSGASAKADAEDDATGLSLGGW